MRWECPLTNATTPDEKQSARIATVEQHIRLENQHDLEGVISTFGDAARYDDEPWHEHYDDETECASFTNSSYRSAGLGNRGTPEARRPRRIRIQSHRESCACFRRCRATMVRLPQTGNVSATGAAGCRRAGIGLPSASDSAIKRITAGVKACR